MKEEEGEGGREGGVPFGIENRGVLVFCFILGDVPTITREHRSSLKSVSHVLIILTTLLAMYFSREVNEP